MWGEGCALWCGNRIVWAIGQGHPQLSNGLWGAPTVTLTMQSPPISNREWTLPNLTRKIWCRYLFGDCILESKKLSVLPVQWKVYNSFRNLFCSKGRKTAHKGRLDKTILISGAESDKYRQVESNHSWLGQARYFPILFSNFPRRDIRQQAPAPSKAACREMEQPQLPQ